MFRKTILPIVLLTLSLPALGQGGIRFEHSRDAKQAQEHYFESLEELKEDYLDTLEGQDRWFAKSVKPYIDRYTAQLRREARGLSEDDDAALIEALKTLDELDEVERPFVKKQNKRSNATGWIDINDKGAGDSTGGVTGNAGTGSDALNGYYTIEYGGGNRRGEIYMVGFTPRGGTVYYVIRPNDGGKRTPVDYDIEIVKQDTDSATLRHKNSAFGGEVVQQITFDKGKPAGVRFWPTERAYLAAGDAGTEGTITPLGTRTTDLAGWSDGVYLFKLDAHRGKNNKPDSATLMFEFTVKDGYVALTRHNRSGRLSGWSDWHPFVMDIEVDKNKLTLTYDPTVYGWQDVFVITLDDDGDGRMRHWWRKDWYEKGQSPSATGEMSEK